MWEALKYISVRLLAKVRPRQTLYLKRQHGFSLREYLNIMVLHEMLCSHILQAWFKSC